MATHSPQPSPSAVTTRTQQDVARGLRAERGPERRHQRHRSRRSSTRSIRAPRRRPRPDARLRARMGHEVDVPAASWQPSLSAPLACSPGGRSSTGRAVRDREAGGTRVTSATSPRAAMFGVPHAALLAVTPRLFARQPEGTQAMSPGTEQQGQPQQGRLQATLNITGDANVLWRHSCVPRDVQRAQRSSVRHAQRRRLTRGQPGRSAMQFLGSGRSSRRWRVPSAGGCRRPLPRARASCAVRGARGARPRRNHGRRPSRTPRRSRPRP